MKKLWYLLFLIIFYSIVCIIIQLTQTEITMYLDIPSLLIILFFDLLISLFFYGMSESWQYYKAVFTRESDPLLLNKGIAYFRNMTSVTLTAGLLGFILGIIGMLANMKDTAKMGPNLAVALITVLYAGVLIMTVFIPFRIVLEKREL